MQYVGIYLFINIYILVIVRVGDFVSLMIIIIIFGLGFAGLNGFFMIIDGLVIRFRFISVAGIFLDRLIILLIFVTAYLMIIMSVFVSIAVLNAEAASFVIAMIMSIFIVESIQGEQTHHEELMIAFKAQMLFLVFVVIIKKFYHL